MDMDTMLCVWWHSCCQHNGGHSCHQLIAAVMVMVATQWRLCYMRCHSKGAVLCWSVEALEIIFQYETFLMGGWVYAQIWAGMRLLKCTRVSNANESWDIYNNTNRILQFGSQSILWLMHFNECTYKLLLVENTFTLEEEIFAKYQTTSFTVFRLVCSFHIVPIDVALIVDVNVEEI